MGHALSIFEKYLGQNIPQSNGVSANIADINQAIGMLQTIDKCLKNCQMELHSIEQIHQLTQNCSFMGKELFNQNIFIQPIQKSFYIQDFSTLKDADLEKMIQEKRDEISKLLNEIFDFLDCEDDCKTASYETKSNTYFGAF